MSGAPGDAGGHLSSRLRRREARPRAAVPPRGHPLAAHTRSADVPPGCGGIVAVPTCSLPEYLGGVHTGTIGTAGSEMPPSLSLLSLDNGYKAEAVAWREWLVRTIAESPDHRSCTASPGNPGWANPAPGRGQHRAPGRPQPAEGSGASCSGVWMCGGPVASHQLQRPGRDPRGRR